MTAASPAAEGWAESLAGWALPAELLASVDQSPYAWPARVFARTATRRPDPVTGPLLLQLLPEAGTLIDVGAGTGRLSLPIAAAGHRVLAVEPNAAMAAELERGAASMTGSVAVVRRRWPEVAAAVGPHDVALTANVVYDVADIGPFLQALDHSATLAVVVELTQRHPWDGLRGYYRSLHDVELPDGPTVDDLVAVIGEVIGVTPQRCDWPSPRSLTFESRDALLELYATRLCVPDDRRSELEQLIGDDIEEIDDGAFALRLPSGGMTTLWWEKAANARAP